jgi:aminomethyltransferase
MYNALVEVANKIFFNAAMEAKKTILYDRHASAGARMGAFGGWAMPIQYRGILEEHHWTRERASIFDICHMGEFDVAGPSAADDLDRLLTQDVRGLAVGRCRYGYLLGEDGGILDDLTCYRLGEDRYRLVVNAATRAGDAAWIRPRLSEGAAFCDRSDETGKIDVQGPRARECVEEALGVRLPDLRYFGCEEIALDGAPFLVSRTGYTGEFGYELYLPTGDAPRFWDALAAHPGIRPAGLGARDTLRLEIGYPLYGQDLDESMTPVEAGGMAFVCMDRPFVGREAVRQRLREGPARVLAPLVLDSRAAARPHDRVLDGARDIGAVTSGAFAPSLGVAVALAVLRADRAAPGTRIRIASRRRTLSAVVGRLPFYSRGTARGA